MGVAQQKEASAYFTQALTSDSPPDPQAFTAKARHYQDALCGGSELSGVAEPVARALLEASATHHGQLRWLLQLVSALLRRCIDDPSSITDSSPSSAAGAPAVLHVAELLLRHLLRMTEGQSVRLVSVLECGGLPVSVDMTTAEAAAAAGGGGGAAPVKNAVAEPAAASADKEDAAALLCRMCFGVVIHVPLSQSTALLHLEVLRLLLTLTSSALHHSTELREDTMDLFTELMMSSEQLHELVDALLKLIAAWGKPDGESPAALLYHEGCRPSIRSFFQVFGGGGASADESSGGGARPHAVPYVLEVELTAVAPPSSSSSAAGVPTSSAAASSGAPGVGWVVPKDPAAVLRRSCSSWQLIGRHAAALLSVLMVHQKGSGRNPALEYVSSLQDGSPVSFVRLLTAIRWRMTQYPDVSILLYVLLHDHHDFLHTILSQDAALLVTTLQQLLELTYRTCKDPSRPAPPAAAASSTSGGAGSSSAAQAAEDVLQTATLGRLIYQLRVFSYPFINFMSSTLLLLLSQDCVVNRLLGNTPCLPGHLLERYDANAPVGALAVVVLCLGITKGYNERNEALIAVFAPCLVNLAPFVHDMDPYTAQRVSSLLTLVLKKIQRAGSLLTKTTGAAAVVEEEAQALEGIVAMYARQLRTIVEGVEALLRGPNRRNEHLVYELLYARSKIIDDVDAAVASNSPAAAVTKQLLTNIVEMIKNCEADIASSDQAQSPQEIIAILRRGQQQQCGTSGSMESGDAGGGAAAAGSATPTVHHNNNSSSGASNTVEMTSVGGGGTSRSPGPDAAAPPDAASMDLVYSYEESPHSYDFFGPFVWSVLLSAARAPGNALWCHRSSELALFPH